MVGSWVLVRLSKKGGGATTPARFDGEESGTSGSVRITAYRRYPERLESLRIAKERIVGVAPENEKLVRARELYELREFGKRRRRSGLSQRDFAQIVGVDVQTVRHAEKGTRHTQPQIRHWIFQALAKLEKTGS